MRKIVEKNTQDVSSLVTNTVSNTKTGEIENKIPAVSYLVKKMNCNTKISGTEAKNFNTSGYNKFRSKILKIKIKEKGLVDKSNVCNLTKNSDLNTKLAALAKRAELKEDQDKVLKLQAFDSSYFHGKSHFEGNGMQNNLVPQPVHKYFKKLIIAIIFHHENQKDCLIKVLNLLLHLITVSLQH